MNISAPFIARPVATTLFTIGIALAGALAFFKLPVAPVPQVDIPTVRVLAQLPGASPETVANSVASPLERHLGQIADVTEMTSSSSLGLTSIALQFGSGSRHRRRRARRAGGHQRREGGPADEPAHEPDLSQGQSGRRADRHSGSDLQDADARPDVRRGEQCFAAAALATGRRRTGHHRRRDAARRARRTQSRGAKQIWREHGGRARRARLGQRQQPERRHRRGLATLSDLRQRSGHARRRLCAAGHRLSQRRRGAFEGRGHGPGLGRRPAQRRIFRRGPGGRGDSVHAARRQYHRHGGSRQSGIAAHGGGDARRH